MPNLAAAKLKAQYLARRLDVEKAGNPVQLDIRRARASRRVVVGSKVKAGED